MNTQNMLAFISMPGTTEWLVIGVVALLIFGRRLPEVARSLGKGIVEFKKGLQDVESEVERAASETQSTPYTTAGSSETTHETPTESTTQVAHGETEPVHSEAAVSTTSTMEVEPARRDDPPKTYTD